MRASLCRNKILNEIFATSTNEAEATFLFIFFFFGEFTHAPGLLLLRYLF